MPRKRRQRSWGSIRSVSRDVHVLRWWANTEAGRTRQCMTFRGSRAEAELMMDRLHVEHADRGDRPVPTVGLAYAMWYEPWLARRLANGKIKPSTHRLYTGCWVKHIQPRWGNVPVTSVEPLAYQTWLLTLSESMARIAALIMQRLLDFAVQYDLVKTNKARLPYELPTTRVIERRIDTYDLQAAIRILGQVRGTPSEAPYILACFGSARTGESLGVRAEEVELRETNGMSVAVCPIIRRMDKTGDLPLPDGDLKTPQSERHLVIPEPYGTRLHEIAQDRIATRVEWLADRGDGLPMNKGTLRRTWERDAAEDAIPFSNLRPSWRTIAEYEWHLEYDTMELLMGHKIPGVTGQHYLRPTLDNLVDSVTRSLSEALR